MCGFRVFAFTITITTLTGSAGGFTTLIGSADGTLQMKVNLNALTYRKNSCAQVDVSTVQEKAEQTRTLTDTKYIKIKFGQKYEVEKGLRSETWCVRRPRLWQEKLLGVLHCFRWQNCTRSWEPNTFVKETSLLTSTGGSMGRGLFAMRDFAEGELIGYYSGNEIGTVENKDDPELKAFVQGKDSLNSGTCLKKE
jgi:hypothetical protein